MSGNLEILCFYSGIIVNTNNCITYNGGIHEFLIVTLDLSLNELSKMLCDRIGWNMFEIEVEIIWRILQIGVSQARYFGVPISSDRSLNSLFRFTRINMLKLNLNSRPRREKSFSIELIWLPSNSQRTTQASRATDLSRLGGNASR